jgi:hypothetical protein
MISIRSSSLLIISSLLLIIMAAHVHYANADLWDDLGNVWDGGKKAVVQGGSDAHEWFKNVGSQ